MLRRGTPGCKRSQIEVLGVTRSRMSRVVPPGVGGPGIRKLTMCEEDDLWSASYSVYRGSLNSNRSDTTLQ